MDNIRLLKMTDSDPRFWPLLGPMFASEKVFRARHNTAMFTDPFTVWYVAVDDSGVVQGWASVRQKSHLFVVPVSFAFGNAALLQQLAAACAADFSPLQSVVHHSDVPAFAAAGFQEVKARGNYRYMMGGLETPSVSPAENTE